MLRHLQVGCTRSTSFSYLDGVFDIDSFYMCEG
jgi:hypothetical protein